MGGTRDPYQILVGLSQWKTDLKDMSSDSKVILKYIGEQNWAAKCGRIM
jgi:hypothetical protein